MTDQTGPIPPVKSNGVITVTVQFNPKTNQIGLQGPLASEEQKMLTAKILAAAIPIALNYNPPVIQPVRAGAPLPKLTVQ